MKLLKFETKTCGPCKLMKPVLIQYAQEHPDIPVEIIDVEEDASQAAQRVVRGVPTIILVDSTGNEVWRHVGTMGYSELCLAIEKNIQ